MTQQLPLFDLPDQQYATMAEWMKAHPLESKLPGEPVYLVNEETPLAMALRFRRESAEIRAQLRQAAIKEQATNEK